MNSQAVTAMVLAAGKGTRLGPLTQSIPKPMLPVNGRPIIDHTLQLLANAGVTNVVINVHHCANVLTDFCGDGAKWGLRIRYSHEPQLLGTAGTVRSVASLLDSDPFLVLYGDNYFECDLSTLIDFHRQRAACATMAVIEKEDVTSSGIVELDAAGRIQRFKEKPTAVEAFSRLVNAGAYVMNREIVGEIPGVVPCDFGRDVFPALIAAGKALYGVQAGHVWACDTPALYEALRHHVSHG